MTTDGESTRVRAPSAFATTIPGMGGKDRNVSLRRSTTFISTSPKSQLAAYAMRVIRPFPSHRYVRQDPCVPPTGQRKVFLEEKGCLKQLGICR